MPCCGLVVLPPVLRHWMSWHAIGVLLEMHWTPVAVRWRRIPRRLGVFKRFVVLVTLFQYVYFCDFAAARRRSSDLATGSGPRCCRQISTMRADLVCWHGCCKQDGLRSLLSRRRCPHFPRRSTVMLCKLALVTACFVPGYVCQANQQVYGKVPVWRVRYHRRHGIDPRACPECSSCRGA